MWFGRNSPFACKVTKNILNILILSSQMMILFLIYPLLPYIFEGFVSLVNHQFSIETMDHRWTIDGVSMEYLRTYNVFLAKLYWVFSFSLFLFEICFFSYFFILSVKFHSYSCIIRKKKLLLWSI